MEPVQNRVWEVPPELVSLDEILISKYLVMPIETCESCVILEMAL